jgi:hypothetical protein
VHTAKVFDEDPLKRAAGSSFSFSTGKPLGCLMKKPAKKLFRVLCGFP